MNNSPTDAPGAPSGTHEVVWIDDGPVDATTAAIHWSDHGITVGDGVFETIKSVNGHPFALGAHLDRLERSAAGLALTLPPRSAIAAAAHDVALRFHDGNGADTTARLRITVTAGRGPAGSERGNALPTLIVTAGPMTLSREPTDVVVAPWTRNERGALAGIKSTSYAENVVALALARRQGASEAIFANTRGELCEGTGTNVFVEDEGILVTPPLDSGCLDGITRALLMDALRARGCAVEERTLGIDAVRNTTEAFLVSTGREVQPIARVDSVPLSSAPGPLTVEAMTAWDHHLPQTDT